MDTDEIVRKVNSMVDGFDGADSEYIQLLKDIISECECRLEGKEEELEDNSYE